jgi:hypothetical protein
MVGETLTVSRPNTTLPSIGVPTSATKPIQYNLSQADIAGPYTAIAQASDKAAGALEDAAEPLAAQAASEAVRRDNHNNLVVDKLPPLFGGAATQARLTIAAKLQPQIETDLLKLKLDSHDDPAAYQKSVDTYKPHLLKGMDAQLAVGVGKMIDSTGQQYLRSLLVEKHTDDTREALQTYQSQIKDTVEQMTLLARQGATTMPTDSGPGKEFADRAKDLATFYDKLQINPDFKYSAARAKLELNQHYSGFKVQEKIGQVQRQFMDDQDLPKATQALIDGFWGPNAPKNLTRAQRDQGVSEGLSHLRNLASGDAEAIQQSRKAAQGFIQLGFEKPGAEFPIDEWNNVRQNAERLKDKRSLDALDEFKEMWPLAKTMLQAGPDGRARILADMQKGIVPEFRTPAEREASPTSSLIEGKRIDLATNAYAVSQFQTLTKTLEGKVSKDTDEALARIEKDAKAGAPVQPEDIAHFAENARRSGNEAALEKAQPWLKALDLYYGRPAGETYDQLTGWIAAQRANGVSAMEADTLDHLDAIAKAHDERFRQNPRAEAAAMGLTGEPGRLTFSAADAGTLAARDKANGKINQAVPGTGVIPAIMPDEAKQLATVLTAGDPKQAGDFLATLKGATSPETYRATMESPGVKEAMITAFNSNVPQRLDTMGQVLTGLWDTNSRDFEANYGEHAATRVNQWKALASVDPDTRAKKLSSIESPKDEKDLAEAVGEEVKGTSPQNVADKLGNFWQRNFPLVHKGLPRDILHGDTFAGIAMKNEYTTAYQALRQVGVNQTDAQQMAVERISAKWQPSEMNGGHLMRNPPESSYPVNPMTGDHAYMLDQLKADITKTYGHEQVVTNEGIIPGWQLKGIISDPKSEREAAAYDRKKPVGPDNQPPSFPVHIIDANGKDQLLGGPGKRYQWDVNQMMEEGRSTVSRTVGRADVAKARNLRPMEGAISAPGAAQSLGATPFMSGGR